jgi:hemerythrin superfamily protein
MANHENAIDARATFITLMLREDHQKLKELFDQFGKTTNKNEKRNIVTAAIAALEIHATLEEELIYPAWQEHVDEQGLTDKALAEHHVVHLLIQELKEMNPEDERYNAKFTALSERVTHHIKEEEKIFPQAEKADVDWDRLTKQVIERRQSLEQKTLWLLGVPVIVSARETTSATRGVLSYRPESLVSNDRASINSRARNSPG